MSLAEKIEKLRAIPAVDPSNPQSGSPVNVLPSETTVKRFIGNRQRTKLFELCYLLGGFPPPVNNVGMHERNEPSAGAPETSSLSSPEFLFQGLRRPFLEVGAENSVCVYVLKPIHTYEYIPDMACVAIRKAAPPGLCFVVYVRELNDGRFIAVNWEWVKCDSDGRPNEHQDRYNKEISL